MYSICQTFILLAVSIASFDAPNVFGQDRQGSDESPPRKRLSDVIGCINEDDQAERAKFLKSGFTDQDQNSANQRFSFVDEIRASMRGLVVEEISREKESRIVAVCKADSGSRVEIYLRVEEDPPHRIREIEFEPVRSSVSKGDYRELTSIPQNERGQLLAEILEAINTEDENNIAGLISSRSKLTTASAAEQTDTLLEIIAVTGGLEFHSIREYEERVENPPVVAIAKGVRFGKWHAIVVETEGNSNFRKIRIAAARPPKSLAVHTISEEAGIELVSAYFDDLVNNKEFSGAVLVAQGDRILFHKASGLASRRFGVPNRIDTKFNLGSMNKMFTGIAICQLIESGLIKEEDSIDKFLSSDWIPDEVASKIKIKHLLTHTSGIGQIFEGSIFAATRNQPSELDDYRSLLSTDIFCFFEPGDRYRYSNSGMFLLGVVVEKVTGQSYFEYVREHIYKPAGMENSDSYAMDQPVPNLAIGYFTRDGEVVNNLPSVYRGSAAGGGYSTTTDLLKFSRALMDNRLMNSEMTTLVTSSKPELNSPNYGYGFQVRPEFGAMVVGHSGGTDGVSARMDILPESGVTIVVLSNFNEPAEDVAKVIRKTVMRIE